MGKLLVSIELKHDSLDDINHFNNVLVMLYGFIFAIPYQLGEKTLGALPLKNHEGPFQILFQNFLSVNNFFILASMIPFWTIVSAVSPASNTGSIGTDRVSFDIFLTAY